MNVGKLRKLKRYILTEPRRYRQDVWLVAGPHSPIVQEQQPPCGTVGCLAGNACLMEGYLPGSPKNYIVHKKGERRQFETVDLAQKILGLTDKQAANLFAFAADGWSSRAHDAYFDASDMRGRAQAAAMAIDDFIASAAKKKSATKSKH